MLAPGCGDWRRFRFIEGPVKRVAEIDEIGEVAVVDPIAEQFSESLVATFESRERSDACPWRTSPREWAFPKEP